MLYVDDMVVVGKDKTKIIAIKKALSKSFVMKDLGAIMYAKISQKKMRSRDQIKSDYYL